MPTTTGLVSTKKLLVVAGAVEKLKTCMNRELYPIDWSARRMLLKVQAAKIAKSFESGEQRGKS